MFRNEGNYEFFLKKYDYYLSPVLDTYAYCLLGNHFHLLVRIKSSFVQADLTPKDLSQTDLSQTDLTTFGKLSNLNLSNLKTKSDHSIVSHQFQKFFQSYAMAFNGQQNRIGTLFQTPFKRALVSSETHYTRLVYYIHANPQLHGLTNDFREWRWSSYGRMLLDKPSKLKKQEVLNWFNGKKQYEQFHSEKYRFGKDDQLFFEDD